jgi:pyruvate-formate lyase-activating enzyme
MRSGFLPDRIVHLHPTRHCNLACLHCYSASDPRQTAALDPAVVGDALAILRDEGYAAVSLSGGDPLVYQPLGDVVDRAHALGLRVTMITNGLLVNERTMPMLAALDGIAVSFDGLEDSHNALRRRPDAFARACAAVERLASAGRPVAAAVSLARDAIAELPDLVDHLMTLGVNAFQVRPVARAGRARGLAASMFYGATDRARLYLVVLALRRELPEIRLHCDVAPAPGLWEQRDAYAGLLGSCEEMPYEERPLADLVNPIVITETGALKPIAYDFDPHFDIGTADGLSVDRLRAYKRERLGDLQQLVGGALASLRDRSDLVDWFDDCTRLSEAALVARSDNSQAGLRA